MNPENKNYLTDETQCKAVLIPGYTSMENFAKDGFKTLMESIRHANALPTQGDYSFYNAQESFKKIMHNEGNHILSLINNILKNNGIRNNVKTSILDHKTELLIEANDTILEKVANNIDELNGIRKNTIEPVELQTVSGQLPINGSWNKPNDLKFSVNSSLNLNIRQDGLNLPITLLTAKNIVRPQKLFSDKIDNSNSYPWEPRIKEKPNSLKPLAIFLEETNRGEEFSHPYEFELVNFSPPTEQLSTDLENPVYPKSLDGTKFIEVSTQNQLDELVEDLRKYNIIAVDLEHHSYRTFMGITCLMQISTEDTDYIIDTLTLRDKLHSLNEIFTKPNILKVFHGADSDILWLQRDLALYVVNMFDTHQAVKLLEYSSLSLSSLLERFCNFKPNKHFQLADWRIRPLPEVLKEYAREDTHYLIYIYRMLKDELLKKAGGTDKLLRTVYQRSRDICMQRFYKQRWTEESHLDFYRICKRMFDNRQMFALRELYKWRDQIAREEDESTGYVLPNHMLLQISETLPREMQGILACCNPIPPLVRSNLLEIHQIILKARDQPIERQILQEDSRARGSTIQLQKLNVDSPLHCPHDLSRSGDFRDDLPTLLNVESNVQSDYMNAIKKKCYIEKETSKYRLFEDEIMDTCGKSKKHRMFLSPFERYQFVKPFIQDEEKKIIQEREKKIEKEQNIVDTKPNIDDIKPRISEISGVIEIQDDIDKVNQNLKNLVQENRTDEERIASIRDHFTMLSKKTLEDEEMAKKREEQLYQKATKLAKEQTQSLIEMGGTKKRKREQGNDDHLLFENPNLEHRLLNPAPYQKSGNYVSLGQKRKKHKDSCEKEELGTPLKQIWKTKKVRNKAKAQRDRPNSQRKTFKKSDPKDLNNKKEGGHESKAECSNDTSSEQNWNRPPENFSQQNHNRKRKRSVGNNFEAFDYTSVDFRQFQGGAGSVHQGKDIKSSFKNKGRKKNMNKAFNKSGILKNSGRKR